MARNVDTHLLRRLGACCLGLLVVTGMSLPDAAAQERRARNKADEWIGRDARDLLLQLRVDSGQVAITEDDDSGETRYTWDNWTRPWVETYTTGGNVVGMAGGGNGMAPTPIFDGPAQQHEVHHPARHRCTMTYIADMEGIIRRWEMTGSDCASTTRRPR